MAGTPEQQDQTADEVTHLREEIARLTQQLQASESVYSHFVPKKLLNLLNVKDIRDVRLGMQTERRLTVLFADIRDFTAQSEAMTPQENFNFLNSFMSQMDPVISLHKGLIDKFIGDAIMALFPDSPDDALRGALAMQERLEVYNHGRARAGYSPTRIGIGINTGIVMLGTVGGANRMEATVISDAVNLASRLEGLTKDYGSSVLISEHTLNSLDHPEKFMIRFVDRICVRGKHEPQSIYEVYDGDAPQLRTAKQHAQPMFEEALAHYHLHEIARARTLLLECLDTASGDLVARVYLARCDEYLTTGRYIGESDGDLDTPWTEDYSVGVSEDDATRRALLAQLGHLAMAIRDGHKIEVESTLYNIKNNSRLHFAAQEALMLNIDYPFRIEHTRQHRRFLSNLETLGQRIERRAEAPDYLAFSIKVMLGDFLINHSLKFDRHLYQFKRQREG